MEYLPRAPLDYGTDRFGAPNQIKGRILFTNGHSVSPFDGRAANFFDRRSRVMYGENASGGFQPEGSQKGPAMPGVGSFGVSMPRPYTSLCPRHYELYSENPSLSPSRQPVNTFTHQFAVQISRQKSLMVILSLRLTGERQTFVARRSRVMYGENASGGFQPEDSQKGPAMPVVGSFAVSTRWGRPDLRPQQAMGRGSGRAPGCPLWF